MARATAPTISAKEQKEHDDYRAKEDARTLQEAEAIHDDDHRLNGAHKHLRHAQDALRKTVGRLNRRIGRRKSNRR